MKPPWSAAGIAALDLVRMPGTQASPKGFQMKWLRPGCYPSVIVSASGHRFSYVLARSRTCSSRSLPGRNQHQMIIIGLVFLGRRTCLRGIPGSCIPGCLPLCPRRSCRLPSTSICLTRSNPWGHQTEEILCRYFGIHWCRGIAGNLQSHCSFCLDQNRPDSR